MFGETVGPRIERFKSPLGNTETEYEVLADKLVIQYYVGGSRDINRLVIVKQDNKFNCFTVSEDNKIVDLIVDSDASFNTLDQAKAYITAQPSEINPQNKEDAIE